MAEDVFVEASTGQIHFHATVSCYALSCTMLCAARYCKSVQWYCCESVPCCWYFLVLLSGTDTAYVVPGKICSTDTPGTVSAICLRPALATSFSENQH
eukprot:2520167-Rhodomonas_salina.2